VQVTTVGLCGELFEERMMDLSVNIPLEEALDLGWKTLTECFVIKRPVRFSGYHRYFSFVEHFNVTAQGQDRYHKFAFIPAEQTPVDRAPETYRKPMHALLDGIVETG